MNEMKQVLLSSLEGLEETPSQWLEAQRVARRPDEVVWKTSMFEVPGFEEALGISKSQAMIECGILCAIEEVSDASTRVLLDLIDRAKAGIFEVELGSGILIIPLNHKQEGLFIDQYGVREADICTCCIGLLESWSRNPDPVRALKARHYLCSAVGRLLTD